MVQYISFITAVVDAVIAAVILLVVVTRNAGRYMTEYLFLIALFLLNTLMLLGGHLC